MISRTVLGLVVVLAGCSDLISVQNGVVTLELEPPLLTQLEVGQTVRLVARARDLDGNVVEAPIRWVTPDTVLMVESTTGDVTATLAGGGTGRVQAILDGSPFPLVSLFVTFTVTARADTLFAIGDTVVVVPPDDATSPALVTVLASRQPDGPLSGRMVTYRIVSPSFADPAARTVELGDGLLTVVAATDGLGNPTPAVQVRRVPGVTPPDTTLVEVSAVQATGAVVPGSGLRFVVLFPPPPPPPPPPPSPTPLSAR